MKNMHSEHEILRASLGDGEEILSLQKLAYQSEARIYNDETIPPLLQTLEEIRDEFNAYAFLKAVHGGTIVGSVRAHMTGTTCHIGRLIVHPEWQNRGISTRLMTEAERMHSSAARFELFTGSKSLGNIHLYQKLGYRECRREALSSRAELVYLEKLRLVECGPNQPTQASIN